MAKIVQKIPAKINLTLDVKGKIGDMHEIESLVISVNVYDKIIVKKRKDYKITLKEKGILSEFEKTCLKYYLLDNNYIEIALILNVPPKKVDNALSRCKTKLKNLNKINVSYGQSC